MNKYKTQFRMSLSFVHNASRQHIGLYGTVRLQSVRLCYGLRGVYGRFDSNGKKRFAGP